MRLAVRRLVPPLLAAAFVGGCVSLTDSQSFTIPAGATIFRINPQLLQDEFIDTTAGHNLELTWLTAAGFVGWNCFGFSPATPSDTAGTFVFGWVGPNTGRVERRTNNVPFDSVIAYFIDNAAPGTHGTYVVNSSGNLTLNWADGTRNRYFAPTAVLRMHGDTVESRVDLRAKSDSIRDQWHVVWTYSPSCP